MENVKKLIPFLIVGTLVLAGLGATAITDSDQTIVQEDHITISDVSLYQRDRYTTVELPEATSMELQTGAPVVPVISKVYTFPLNTQIKDVTVTFSNWESQTVTTPVQPAPAPTPLVTPTVRVAKTQALEPDQTVYEKNAFYPTSDYTVTKGVGLQGDENVLYVVIRSYPVHYNPVTQILRSAGDLAISITTEPPEHPKTFGDEYDLVIIAPEAFTAQLDPLVQHKNDNGIATTIKTLEEIYDKYDGRDDQEDIKLFIYDARNPDGLNWGIDYVLLVGGRKGQSPRWYLPERVTNNNDGEEPGYSSDLYYADVFGLDESDQTVFEDWDSNENDVFAEWGAGINQRDYMDFYPDVAVGRLTIRYSSELDIIVDKIIAYETSVDDSWFKKGLVVSGDTVPPSRGGAPGIYEGEMSTGITADLLEDAGFTVDKLWLSIPGVWEGPQDVIDAINSGYGLVHVAGHGNPASWGNHPPDDTEHEFIVGLKLKDMLKLRNGNKLPVLVVGGCHNAQFNTTIWNILKGIKEYGFRSYFGLMPDDQDNSYRFWYKEWVPRDWSSMLLLKRGGGTIGTIGNSGYGYGYLNSYATMGLGGWLNPRFFDAYANQTISELGNTHCKAIIDYINIIGNVNSDNIDRKSIDGWVLLGDPSLQIGGFTE